MRAPGLETRLRFKEFSPKHFLKMFGVHWWIHLITVVALAMVFKEYYTMRTILHEEHRVKLWNSGPLPVSPGAFNFPQNPFHPEITTFSRQQDAEETNHGGNILNELESSGSSVWCEGNSTAYRRCYFRNICYLPEYDDFVFFHHERSVMRNVPRDRFNPALLELSSISGHNEFHFNYVALPSKDARTVLKDIVYINEDVLAMKRFLPDNIMHVFHDDLIPIFDTLQNIYKQTKGQFDSKLLFMDSHEYEPFGYLYKTLISQDIMLKSDIQKGKSTCFRSISIGLSKETTWYDYGFNGHQGPLANASVTGLRIQQFVSHFKRSMMIQERQLNLNQKRKLAVLLVRKENRIIVNQNELIETLVDGQFKVATLSLEDNSMQYIIEQISQASVIIGMHGSLMILSVFAPPKSLVLELFPYAIDPDNYTPFKTLHNLPGSDVRYQSWANTDREKTIVFPSRIPQKGGIVHLPDMEQNRILESSEVPKHKCCSDPEFLFRIYQDTIVNTFHIRRDADVYLLQKRQEEESHAAKNSVLFLERTILPGPVRDLDCKSILGKSNPILQVSWKEPWNMQNMIKVPKESSLYLHYELVLQDAKVENSTQKWYLQTKTHEFIENIVPDTEYKIWVRPRLYYGPMDEEIGPFNGKGVNCYT